MITNERQYKITRSQLRKFKNAIDNHNFDEAMKRLGSVELITAEVEAMQSEFEILTDQIAEYETLISGSIKKFTATSLQELPKVLIRSRIAKRLTQRELAEMVGLKEQQIQRYEASFYSGANIKRLNEIAEALKLNINNIIELSTQVTIASKQSHQELDWGKFPIREMYKKGWFEDFPGTLKAALDPSNQVAKNYVKNVLRQPTPAYYRRQVRTGKTINDYSLFAWECRVRSLAQKKESVVNFNSSALNQDWINYLAKSSKSPDKIAKVVDILAEVGILLIIEPHLSGTYLDGAVFLFNDSPIIGMTLRYDRLDHFWFVLLHELGHIVQHLKKGKIDRFFDNFDEAGKQQIEIEADRFSQESLLPTKIWDQAICRFVQTEESVMLLAEEIGIHPSIIAGRIRFEANNYMILNDLVGQGEVRKKFPNVLFGV